MQLFYNTSISKNDTSFTFDKIESRHIIKVLRKKEGDLIKITNGNGLLFLATITLASDKHCTVKILDIEFKEKIRKYNIHIAIAPTKNNDRMEWFLEKCTEIGIDEITPLLCEHSERKVIKPERFEKIILTAAKQSLQFHLPKLNPFTKFSKFIKQEQVGLKCIAHCEKSAKEAFQETVVKNKEITILIGPEGDFSLNEIEQALQHSYIAVSLGQSRLRTETAGIVACHTAALMNA